MIDAISSITPLPASLELDSAARPSGADFSQMLGGSLKALNTDLYASDEVLRNVAAGQNIPLHDVMIVMTRAQISMQFAVELRNRLVESYQQLSQMQI